MFYNDVRADETIGTMIGQLYMDTPEVITPEVIGAYQSLAFQVGKQFDYLTNVLRIDVTFQDEDPYSDYRAMFQDVQRGRLKIYRTSPDQSHPILHDWQNDRFRAVHDFFGHFRTGRGFDRHGEEAAWLAHSGMFEGSARRAMTTETRGQSSAFIWLNGGREFPPQKAILLPQWVSETNGV